MCCTIVTKKMRYFLHLQMDKIIKNLRIINIIKK